MKGMVDQLSLELGIEKRKTASTGVSSKAFKSKEIRRTIARIHTVLKERSKKV